MQKKVQPLVSTVLVTRDRARSLQKALLSLSHQVELPDEVVIIDNDSTDLTQRVILQFQNRTSIPVTSFTEKKVGYPFVYNAGLKKAQQDWVAFLDDDCLADIHWIKTLKKSIATHPQSAAILGESKTRSPQNIFSLATYILDQNWKKNRIIQGTVLDYEVLDYEVLDNKNIAYNRTFLKKHQITFDETRVGILGGAAEDCDLGKQIEMAGGKAIYSQDALVYHQDPLNWTWFWKRNLKSFAAYLTFRHKWPTQKIYPQKIRLKMLISENEQRYHYDSVKKLQLRGLISLTVGISLVLSKLLKSKVLESAFIRLTEKL